VKINCDRACKSNGEIVGCGWLFCNSDGRWLMRFSRKIGVCDALHVEIWGLYLGLDMTRREGLSHLIVDSYLKVLIDMVTKICKINETFPSLIWRIQ